MFPVYTLPVSLVLSTDARFFFGSSTGEYTFIHPSITLGPIELAVSVYADKLKEVHKT